MPNPVIDKPFILIHFHSFIYTRAAKSTPLAEVYRLESFIPRIHSLTRQATEEDQTLYFAFPLPPTISHSAPPADDKGLHLSLLLSTNICLISALRSIKTHLKGKLFSVSEEGDALYFSINSNIIIN